MQDCQKNCLNNRSINALFTKSWTIENNRKGNSSKILEPPWKKNKTENLNFSLVFYCYCSLLYCVCWKIALISLSIRRKKKFQDRFSFIHFVERSYIGTGLTGADYHRLRLNNNNNATINNNNSNNNNNKENKFLLGIKTDECPPCKRIS